MISVRRTFALLPALFLSTIALAEGTRIWEQSKFDDLVKGTPKGIALRSNGGLELAPAFKTLATLPSTYVWAIASDAAGNVYAAAGSPARVYRITPDGQSATIFEPQELQVQSLLVDKGGTVYAATAPDGKVYRIAAKAPSAGAKADTKTSPSWSATPYFDPGTKYIWDIVLDSAGNLYVATGDRGEVYRVTPSGQHTLFFKSDEVHIRVLAIDPKGNVIAGSDGSGLIYRIATNGEAFVLYSAPKKEITSLAIDSAGNIYAAGTGEKRAATQGAPTAPVSPPTAPGTPPAAAPFSGNVSLSGSDVYSIAPDGSPKKIWSS